MTETESLTSKLGSSSKVTAQQVEFVEPSQSEEGLEVSSFPKSYLRNNCFQSILSEIETSRAFRLLNRSSPQQKPQKWHNYM